MAYERLSAQDTMFLHLEDQHQPQHLGGLAILEAGPLRDEQGRVRIEDLRARVAARLDRAPRLRKRLAEVPLRQGRPMLVDDARFDLSYHVRLTALPAPGDEEQLLALMGRLQSLHLDRARPLWELWMVDGLTGDRLALIQKTHHCLVDGASAVDLAAVLFDLGPTAVDVAPSPWAPAPAPGPARLLAGALVGQAVQPAALALSLGSALGQPRALLERARQLARAAGVFLDSSPHAFWNVPVSTHRRFRVARVPLAQAMAIKSQASATVNDVALAAVAGGLRRLLLSRREPVEGLVLRAMVPVSLRPGPQQASAAPAAAGNRVAAMVADLPVGEPDPLRRLLAVRDSTSAMKAAGVATAVQAAMALAERAPPLLSAGAIRLAARSRAVNLAVTNIPGPPAPLYLLGARMLEAFPYVQITRGRALSVAVLSYDGQLGFGITGDRDVVADLGVLAEGIVASFHEMSGALGGTSARASQLRRPRRASGG